MMSSQQETKILYTIDSWLKSHILKNYTIKPLLGDAGARRYWRVSTVDGSYIVSHDPNLESLNKHLSYAKEFAKYRVRTPKIIAHNIQKQLILQEDFGDELLITKTSSGEKEQYYQKSILELIKIQKIPPTIWENYDYEKLITEMSLAPEWYCKEHLQAPMGQDERKLFNVICNDIASKILTFPVTLVHRDYHSRNLLITPHGDLGVIDFQDAVIGPISYDLGSLLRDYYCKIPLSMVKKLQQFYLEHAQTGLSTDEFNHMFQLTSLQRHLKVLGIFCRLYYRDNKAQYLPCLKTVIEYIKDAIAELPEYEVIYNLIPFESHE